MAKYAESDKAYGKLPRKLKKKLPKGQAKKNQDMKIASNLKEIAPGILASPGAMKDPAMKKVIDQLKKDPKSLDSSGLGKRWKI